MRSSAAQIPSYMLLIIHSASSRKPGTVNNKYLLNLGYQMTMVSLPKVLSTFPDSSVQNRKGNLRNIQKVGKKQCEPDTDCYPQTDVISVISVIYS